MIRSEQVRYGLGSFIRFFTMNDGFKTYRVADPIKGDDSGGFASGRAGSVGSAGGASSGACLRSGIGASQSAMVTVSTLVALLAMAVVFDTAGGRSPLRSDSYSFTIDGAKKCDDSELPIESSLAGRLVRAARNFLGTGVPASSAWHFALSSCSFSVFSTNPGQGMEMVTIRIRWEAALDHLLNIPPPIFI